MNNINKNATKRILSLADAKKDLRGIFDILSKYAESYDAVPPPDSFSTARKLLDIDNYNVVVAGDARQGKSYFINALIGKEILPVDVVVTTSQVFRISYADEESFFLVFEDGARKAISRDDLRKYGTQSDADLEDEPLFIGRKLKWIEVNIPAPNLPRGVHILDTPGLGSLYARHAEIAMSCIESADAVIFVTDCTGPLRETETNLIGTILSLTSNVLFVVSKADEIDHESCLAICSRNTAILKDKFGENHDRDFRFWPVSSSLFLEAGGDEDLRGESGFPDMLKALSALFERACGLQFAKLAYLSAKDYYIVTAKFRDERKHALEDSSKESATIAGKRSHLLSFQSEWGNKGTKLLQVQGMLAEAKTKGKALFDRAFTEVRSKYCDEIESIDDSDDLSEFCDGVQKRLEKDVQEKIVGVKTCVVAKLKEIANNASLEIDKAEVPLSSSGDISYDEFKGLAGQIGGTFRTGFFAFSTAALAVKALSTAGLTGLTGAAATATAASTATVASGATAVINAIAVAAPIAPILLLAISIPVLISWNSARTRRLAQAKQDLKSSIANAVEKWKGSLLRSETMEDPPLISWLSESCQRVVNAIKARCDEQISREEGEIAKLDADARNRTAAKKNLELLGASLADVKSQLIAVHDFIDRFDRESAKAL